MNQLVRATLQRFGILVTDTGLISEKAKLHIEAPVNIAGQIGASGVIGAHTYIRKERSLTGAHILEDIVQLRAMLLLAKANIHRIGLVHTRFNMEKRGFPSVGRR